MQEFTLKYKLRDDIPNRTNKPTEIRIKVRANSQSDAIQQGYREAVRQSSNYTFVDVVDIR